MAEIDRESKAAKGSKRVKREARVSRSEESERVEWRILAVGEVEEAHSVDSID